MSRLGKSIIPSSRLSPFLPCRSNGRQFRPTRAKKPSIGENSQARSPTFSLRISKAFLARSAVAVFALGFLDAGQKRHGREDWCLKRRQLKVDDPRNKNATGEKTVTQSEGNQRSMILTDKKIIKDKVGAQIEDSQKPMIHADKIPYKKRNDLKLDGKGARSRKISKRKKIPQTRQRRSQKYKNAQREEKCLKLSGEGARGRKSAPKKIKCFKSGGKGTRSRKTPKKKENTSNWVAKEP